MKKYPSYCCQNCGELIGWIGRIMPFHRCKPVGVEECLHPTLEIQEHFKDKL